MINLLLGFAIGWLVFKRPALTRRIFDWLKAKVWADREE